MTKVTFKTLPGQKAFLDDKTTPYLGLIGGYGSGKTRGLVYKALQLCKYNPGYTGIITEPTHKLLMKGLVPVFNQVLRESGMIRDRDYTFTHTPIPEYKIKLREGVATIYLISAHEPDSLVSYNAAWCIADELDVMPAAKAEQVWDNLIGRVRTGNMNQHCITSTPEGFGFLYKYFEQQADDTKRIIRAKTADNIYISADYVDKLRAKYTPQQCEAYLNGHFVNLSNSSIYYNFNRTLNNTNLSIRDVHPGEVLHIGVDFNVDLTCAIASIVRDGKVYTIDEIVKQRDTTALIQSISSRYHGHRVMIYPDSSGKNRKTNATQTDISLLQNAFGVHSVQFQAANPAVKDRINSVNALILNAKNQRRHFVNVYQCPHLTQALEQQAYDRYGEPDKSSGLDHYSDALGYSVLGLFPIQAHYA